MPRDAADRRRSWTLRLGLWTAALSGVALLAPTYVAARQAGDPALACIDAHVRPGHSTPYLEDPDRARLDWLSGSVECEWDRPRGTVAVEHSFGGDAVRFGSRVGLGLGVGVALMGVLTPRNARCSGFGKSRTPNDVSRAAAHPPPRIP